MEVIFTIGGEVKIGSQLHTNAMLRSCSLFKLGALKHMASIVFSEGAFLDLNVVQRLRLFAASADAVCLDVEEISIVKDGLRLSAVDHF